MNNKRITKKCLILFLTIILVFSFTGCGVAGAGDKKNDGSDTNQLYQCDDENRVFCNSQGETWDDSLKIIKIDPTVDPGPAIKEGNISLVRDTADMMAGALFGAGSTKTAFSGDTFGNLTLNPGEIANNLKDVNFNAESAFGGIKALAQGVALTILITVWFINFMKLLVDDRATLEVFLKGFLQLLCGVAVVTNADIFIDSFYKLGLNFVNVTATGSSNVSRAFLASIKEFMEKDIYGVNFGLNFAKIIMYALFTAWIDFYPFIAALIMAWPFMGAINLCIKIISTLVVNKFELFARLTFAPIPLAFSLDSGFSQNMIRYLRKIMATAAQPALIFIGLQCLEAIVNAISAAVRPGNNAVALAIVTGMAFSILGTYITETKRIAQDVIAG